MRAPRVPVLNYWAKFLDFCAALPAWLSSLVRQELSGFPPFRASASMRATLLDPGKPSTPSPCSGVAVPGSGQRAPSPLAARVYPGYASRRSFDPAAP